MKEENLYEKCEIYFSLVEDFRNKLELIQKYIEIETILCIATFSNILSLINTKQLEIYIIGISRNVIAYDV